MYPFHLFSDNRQVLSTYKRKWSIHEFSSFLSQVACQNQQINWRQFVNKTSSHNAFLKEKPLNEVFKNDNSLSLFLNLIVDICA